MIEDDQSGFERLLFLWRNRITAETVRRLRGMASLRHDLELNQLRNYTNINQQRQTNKERIAERERAWREWENRGETEQERRWLERELRENEARARRAQKDREDWWRYKDGIKQERKRQKDEEERLQREELKAARDATERLEYLTEYQKQWPIKWRNELIQARARRAALGRIERLEFDMQIACDALEVWESRFPKASPCPLVLTWRARAVARFNDWSQKAWRSASRVRTDEPQNRELSSPIPSACLHMPKRRHTLSEYDNRRDSIVLDRYYFGIYSGKYDAG